MMQMKQLDLANSAATLANEKAGNANDAAILANEKGWEANTQAIYANEQGDYAKARGLAKEQELALSREGIEGDPSAKIQIQSLPT